MVTGVISGQVLAHPSKQQRAWPGQSVSRTPGLQHVLLVRPLHSLAGRRPITGHFGSPQRVLKGLKS